MNDTESQTDRDDTESQTDREINFVKSFLFFSAGLEREIVVKKEFGVEHSKYEAVGATVLFTAVLASISGGYALYTVFFNEIISILLGFFWGVGIFTIDRLVVIGITRKSNSEGLFAFIKSFGPVVPRIVLAIFIGYLVSEPIKLRIFQSQIQVKAEDIFKDKAAKSFEDEKKKVEDGIKVENKKAEDEAKRKTNEKKDNYKLDEDRKRREELNEILAREARGDNGRDIGEGPAYNTYKQEFDNLTKKINIVVSEINEIGNDLVKLKKDIDKNSKDKIARLEKNLEGDLQNFKPDKISLLDSMVALHELAEEKTTIRDVNIFLTFFFLVIELLPVFAKLSLGSGVYEDLLAKEKERRELKAKEERLSYNCDKKVKDDLREMTSISSETVKSEYKAKNAAKLLRIKTRLDSVQREQELVQKLWLRSKIKSQKRQIQLSEQRLATKINLLAEESADRSFIQIKGLLEKFDEVYNEVIQMRLVLVEETTTKDATDQIHKFEERIREIRKEFITGISDHAQKKSAEDVSRMSQLIVENISNNVLTITDQMDNLFKQVLNDSAAERKRRFTQTHGNFINSLDKNIITIKNDFGVRVIKSVREKLAEKTTDSTSAKLVDNFLNQLEEHFNNQ